MSHITLEKKLITISKISLIHFSIMKVSLAPRVFDSTAMMFITRSTLSGWLGSQVNSVTSSVFFTAKISLCGMVFFQPD